MGWKAAKIFFDEYLRRRKIRRSTQRDKILEIVFAQGRHLSAAEIYALTRKKYPRIGYATVYRAMRLICDAGIAEKVELGAGAVHFECRFGNGHHDHLICSRCGRCVEVVDADIEARQVQLARKHGFVLQRHDMRLFGICGPCRKKGKS